MSSMIQGAAAGFTATAPMTALMETAFDWLPTSEQYPLPPREITGILGQAAGVWQELSENEKTAATLAAHFAYGAAAGSLYGAVIPKKLQNAVTGAAFGMVVWTGSYSGLLPSLGILRPATEHPPGRNALMIAAHLMWGGVLGRLLQRA